MRPQHPLNAESPILVTSSPIIIFFIDGRSLNQLPISLQWNSTEVSPVQPQNAELLMFVTLFGIVTEAKLLQSRKTPCPMLVKLLDIVTEVKPLQFSKTRLPMFVTLLGIVTEVRPVQP